MGIDFHETFGGFILNAGAGALILIALTIIGWVGSAAKQRAAQTTSVASRFGLVIYWACASIAALIFAVLLAAIGLANGPIGQNQWIVSGVLAGVALLVFLFGRVVLFVLTQQRIAEPQPIPALTSARPSGPAIRNGRDLQERLASLERRVESLEETAALARGYAEPASPWAGNQSLKVSR